jgi:hypothetical protein
MRISIVPYEFFGDDLSSSLKLREEARIQWPTRRQMAAFAATIADREPLITNAFGFLDGAKFPLLNPQDALQQNAFYNGWQHSVCISCCFMWTPDGKFRFS